MVIRRYHELSEERQQASAIAFSYFSYLAGFQLMSALLRRSSVDGGIRTICAGTAAAAASVLVFSRMCPEQLQDIFRDISAAHPLSGPKEDSGRRVIRGIVLPLFLFFILDCGATAFNTLIGSSPLSSLGERLHEAGAPVFLTQSDPDTSSVFFLFYFVFLAPVLEETIFRGLFYGALKRYGRGLAICVSALLFGLMHMNFYQFTGAFLSGLIYAVLRDLLGLHMSVILHILTNLTNVLMIPLLELSRAGLMAYYIFLILAMVFSILLTALLFSRKNPKRAANIRYLEVEKSRESMGTVLGNPLLIVCILLCIVCTRW